MLTVRILVVLALTYSSSANPWQQPLTQSCISNDFGSQLLELLPAGYQIDPVPPPFKNGWEGCVPQPPVPVPPTCGPVPLPQPQPQPPTSCCLLQPPPPNCDCAPFPTTTLPVPTCPPVQPPACSSPQPEQPTCSQLPPNYSPQPQPPIFVNPLRPPICNSQPRQPPPTYIPQPQPPIFVDPIRPPICNSQPPPVYIPQPPPTCGPSPPTGPLLPPPSCSNNYPPLPTINLPDYTAPQSTQQVELPSPPVPGERVISNRCFCVKTVVRPQLYRRIVKRPTITRYIKKSYVPVVEKITYNGQGQTGPEPTADDSSYNQNPTAPIEPICD